MPSAYLIDTNVISEARKGTRADAGVRNFFAIAKRNRYAVFLSVITVGELRRGVELIRHRGDAEQCRVLESWLASIVDEFSDWILDIDTDVAQLWGALRVPHPHNPLDKMIAATALVHDLSVVTRNQKHFRFSGLDVLNPFSMSEDG